MPAIETISGYVTAAGSTFTALTMNGSDTRIIRNFERNGGTQQARLLDVASWTQAVGKLRIASPGMHDPINGIRIAVVASDPSSTFQNSLAMQTFEPQENLTIEAQGSSTSGDIEQHALTLYYDNLPGIEARLISENELMAYAEEFLAVEVAITAGTSGGYSGTAAINSTVDNFDNNRDYAVMGITTTVAQGVITLRAVETGNLRIGVPGASAKRELGKGYFIDLSRRTGRACIPVFNSSNKANVILEVTNNENAASPVVTVHLAKLRRGQVS